MQWQQQYFTDAELTNPSISGDSADPDGDSVVNLLEFAFGMHPRVPSQDRVPAAQVTQGQGATLYLVIEFHRRVGESGLDYQLEVSENLIAWEPCADRLTVIGTTPDPDDSNSSTTEWRWRGPQIAPCSNPRLPKSVAEHPLMPIWGHAHCFTRCRGCIGRW
ncbi:MAG TPA: hypothetical protein PLW35_15860 [Verrucomicrobiota bacterium]|nr:hypothetical protein [Verrucomicrobiota bacterium]